MLRTKLEIIYVRTKKSPSKCLLNLPPSVADNGLNSQKWKESAFVGGFLKWDAFRGISLKVFRVDKILKDAVGVQE